VRLVVSDRAKQVCTFDVKQACSCSLRSATVKMGYCYGLLAANNYTEEINESVAVMLIYRDLYTPAKHVA
jgi:hypothetical protein